MLDIKENVGRKIKQGPMALRAEQAQTCSGRHSPGPFLGSRSSLSLFLLLFGAGIHRGRFKVDTACVSLYKLFILAGYLAVEQTLESSSTLLIAFWNIKFLVKQCVPYSIGFCY